MSVTDPRHAPPVQRGREDVALLLVSHDGSRWLPTVLAGVAAQQTPVSCTVAVDTGSQDESASMLSEAFGVGHVVQAASSVTFPRAVRLGLDQLRELGEEPEWVWLLHDDSSPHPEALLALLAGAAEHPDADVLGPMLREWPSLKRLLELGVTISGTGRRETGLERGEYDQGQYSEPRTVLAVNTAGMLVRRRVLEELGGFDDELPIFGNDIDFGWRAARAGHRTVVVPQAIVFHAEAAHRGLRRTPRTGRHTHYQERRAALFTLLANSRARALPFQLVRLTLGTLVRVVGLLLVRAPGQALDELAALVSVASGPRRLLSARRLRREQARVGPDELRPLLAPWWLPYRHGFDAVSDVLAAANQQAADVADRRRAAAAQRDPSSFAARRVERLEQEEDELADTGVVARFLTNPVAVLLAVFVLAVLVGAREAVGVVSGSGLSPAPEEVSEWWSLHLRSWHPLGLGTPVPAPAYVLPLALAGTVLGPTAAVSVLWVLAVPLSLWGGWRFLRVVGRLATPAGAPRWLILWGAITYALLPVLAGAWGAGWPGPVVAGVLLPWLAHAALGFADPEADRRWRAAWRTGLLLAVVTAFTPVAWVFAALVGSVVVVLAFALLPRVMRDRSTWAPPATAVAVVPLLLCPWWLPALQHGAGRGLFLDAGRVPQPPLDGLDLALGRFGDLGAPWWLGLVLPVLAVLALLPRRTRSAVLICWVVALVAAVLAALLGQLRVDLVGVSVPPGSAFLLVAGQGSLLVATVLGALPLTSASLLTRSRSWGQAVALAVVVFAMVLPLGGLVWFLGFSEPALDQQRDDGIPAYMVVSAEAGAQHGVLVVRGAVDDGLEYSVRRGDGVTFGEDEVLALTDEDRRFTDTVRELAARPTDGVADELASRGIEYVVLPAPADPDVAAALDSAIGLVPASAENRTTRAWQVDRQLSADAVTGPRSSLRIGLLVLQVLALFVVAVLCAPSTDRARR